MYFSRINQLENKYSKMKSPNLLSNSLSLIDKPHSLINLQMNESITMNSKFHLNNYLNWIDQKTV